MFSIYHQREQAWDSPAYMAVQNYSHFSPPSHIAQRYCIEYLDDLISNACAQPSLSDYENSMEFPSPVLSDSPMVVSEDPPPPYEACAAFSASDSQDNGILERCPPRIVPAADDISIEEEPSRHVDYLSHMWTEADVRESWRYVGANRGKYENSARLQNAAWRAWAKVRDNLGTISPVDLNWMKDSDDTWLYGPLKASRIQVKPVKASPPASYCRSRKACREHKSILKKRTASEAILQRSPSPSLRAKSSASERSRNHSRRPAQQPESRPIIQKLYDLMKPPRGIQLRSGKRRIHFNQEVMQCIAITREEEWMEKQYVEFGDELSWDRSYIVNLGRSWGGNKTIAPLPPTTLKYHGDALDLQLAVAPCWSWKRYIPLY